MSGIVKSIQLALLAGAGAASFFVARHLAPELGDAQQASEAEGVVEPVVKVTAPRAASDSTPSPMTVVRDATLGKPERSHVVPESKGEAFATLSWIPPVVAPPPAPPPPPPKPAAPVAPPLPFAFFGMLESGASRPQAFLAKGDALLVVAAGDTLENNTYRVDSLGPQQIVLTYLPLNTRQTLNVSGTMQ